ncbi:uroporphyrinogen methylase [Metarhizium album ARSEF 1941]|uniref:Uroporphyrinogen methylase n=1 Tax=Metarhizium album (strain ARSEF 1941) TaxID=1081103 RepID=A0A0B2X4N1_METAS|nr:uroporphyrinogen methylase [Metarhizium album ARSEF 1941]KHO00236.1 uroporphyrinogen methylase [Metarhizium album ARSEF 1941]
MAGHNTMLAGIYCTDNIHLVIGTNPLAAARCATSLAAGAHPVLVAPAAAELHCNLQTKIEQGLVRWHQKTIDEADLFSLGRDEVGRTVDAVFVASGPREPLAARISEACRRNRIPVNVVDAPHLSTFSLLSTHTDGPLQVGVTTNGRGCKLASRVRREVASCLPPGLGAACTRLGELRRRIIQQDADRHDDRHHALAPVSAGDLDDSLGQSALFNTLVPAANDADDDDDDARSRTRRMRWLAQMCEYWPLKRLAAVTDGDMDKLLLAYSSPPVRLPEPGPATKRPRGRIILAGAGPGHPSLLTSATLHAIQTADLVLADKLVPSGVLDLVPRRTAVQIARKFPGNADKAQQELLETALAAVESGRTVLRLKQGDPFIYGRGGEEVAFFRARRLGHRVTVLPGVTSALSAPLLAGIPPTQRGVADQVLLCTGTGRDGRPPQPPEYVAGRTVVFLMALHRVAGLAAELTGGDGSRAPWPPGTPCAVVERASCPDQRVIRTTLRHVVEAVEAEGSRPPGLLVAGAACEALSPSPSALDSPPPAWVVEEGFHGLDLDADEEQWTASLQAAAVGGGS